MIRRLRLVPATLVLSGLLLTSCASSPPPNGPQPNPQQAGSASSLSRSPDSSAVGSETAEEVFNRIAAQVPTASLVKVYTEDDDPNRLLGRPNGYTSKIAFADSRISNADTAGRRRTPSNGAVRSRYFQTRTWRRAAPSTSTASLRTAG